MDSWYQKSSTKQRNEGNKKHKNQELHSRNRFEEICAHLKALSFGALVFKRVQGKFDCLASTFKTKTLIPFMIT